jgi:hypothetical protein
VACYEISIEASATSALISLCALATGPLTALLRVRTGTSTLTRATRTQSRHMNISYTQTHRGSNAFCAAIPSPCLEAQSAREMITTRQAQDAPRPTSPLVTRMSNHSSCGSATTMSARCGTISSPNCRARRGSGARRSRPLVRVTSRVSWSCS